MLIRSQKLIYVWDTLGIRRVRSVYAVIRHCVIRRDQCILQNICKCILWKRYPISVCDSTHRYVAVKKVIILRHEVNNDRCPQNILLSYYSIKQFHMHEVFYLLVFLNCSNFVFAISCNAILFLRCVGWYVKMKIHTTMASLWFWRIQ